MDSVIPSKYFNLHVEQRIESSTLAHMPTTRFYFPLLPVVEINSLSLLFFCPPNVLPFSRDGSVLSLVSHMLLIFLLSPHLSSLFPPALLLSCSPSALPFLLFLFSYLLSIPFVTLPEPRFGLTYLEELKHPRTLQAQSIAVCTKSTQEIIPHSWVITMRPRGF